tara:strand:+ start:472 stop:582 length:111 start_codon:yes stop_codon:yes gene_type:complete
MSETSKEKKFSLETVYDKKHDDGSRTWIVVIKNKKE